MRSHESADRGACVRERARSKGCYKGLQRGRRRGYKGYDINTLVDLINWLGKPQVYKGPYPL